MSRFAEWLLNLEASGLHGDGTLTLRFATPPAAWIMLIGAILSVAFVYRIYRAEPIPLRWKVALMTLRVGAVLTVLFILAQPVLVRRITNETRGHVAILVDRSTSMDAADGDWPASREAEPGPSATKRLNAALRLLPHGDGQLAALPAQHEISLWSFAGSAQRQEAMLESQRIEMGTTTDLATAISAVLKEIPGARLASLIVMSDGRHTAATSLEAALSQAQARRVPIHTIGVGSWEPQRDLRIDSVWHDDEVFVQDSVTLRVQVEARGVDAAQDATVELRDVESGTLLSSYRGELTANQRLASWDLIYRPSGVGRRSLEVRVLPVAGERDTANNTAIVSIRAHEQKLRVLYVEGYPRYEYRFLKNLLVRDPTLESSCLLLSAAPGFAQEGHRPQTRFPASPEELRTYDVVLLGDVDLRREDAISGTQQEWLVEFVSALGGGVGFLAGTDHMPQVVRQTTLEKLLPVALDTQLAVGPQRAGEAQSPRITAEGDESGLFHFAEDRAAQRDIAAALPGWHYVARVLGAQPGANVLATVAGGAGPFEAMPVIVMGRYGAGRTLFVGTDDLWRWREYGDDAYYETFWLGAIRALARGRKFGSDRPWRLETDRKRYVLGDPVQVRLTLRDASMRYQFGDLGVVVRDAHGAVDRAGLQLKLPGSGVWEGTWEASVAGTLTLAVASDAFSGETEPPSCSIEVQSIDLERREPSADRQMLARIAEQTGGRAFWSTDDLSELAKLIPDRSIQTPADIETPLWDTRLIVLVLTSLLATEWILRRALSLP